jgi:two-component system cell cycle response regulator DivK
MKTILLADDSPGGREVVQVALEMAGYRVIEAVDGRAALDLATADPPDLFILDIQMPNLDGYEVIEHLRKDPGFAGIPAIALTASAMRGDQDKALAAGFTRHMSKPVNLSALRQAVAELLE